MSDNLAKLSETIKETGKKIAKKQEKRRQIIISDRRERENFWTEEQKHFPEKKRLAKDIFEWCDQFSKSEYFHKLLEIDSEDLSARISGSESGSLWFYSGGWGHKRGDSFGRWSRLYLTRNGGLLYRTGYKWMSPIDRIEFENPNELAEELTREYLKSLHEYIQSGEVYKNLRKTLESYISR